MKQGDLAAAEEYLSQYLHLQNKAELSPQRVAQSAWLGGVIEALQDRAERAMQRFEVCIQKSQETELPLWEGLGWLGCLMTPAAPERHTLARENVERLLAEQPILQRGLQVADGTRVESGPLLGPTTPLPLLQLLYRT